MADDRPDAVARRCVLFASSGVEEVSDVESNGLVWFRFPTGQFFLHCALKCPFDMSRALCNQVAQSKW